MAKTYYIHIVLSALYNNRSSKIKADYCMKVNFINLEGLKEKFKKELEEKGFTIDQVNIESLTEISKGLYNTLTNQKT